jgi:hypothetical protein
VKPTNGDRLHVLLTADELRAVDNYRFAAQLPTRSDAVRTLISVALSVRADVEGISPEHAAALRLIPKLEQLLRVEGVQQKKPRLVQSKK